MCMKCLMRCMLLRMMQDNTLAVACRHELDLRDGESETSDNISLGHTALDTERAPSPPLLSPPRSLLLRVQLVVLSNPSEAIAISMLAAPMTGDRRHEAVEGYDQLTLWASPLAAPRW
jgi:hypothetical protein